MALLICPDCGNNVSSKAAKCPRCGCPMSVMIQEQQNSEKQQNTEQQNIEESTQEQPQPVEIVNNEEKIIEEQPKVSVQKEEKVVETSIKQKSAKKKTTNIIEAIAIIIFIIVVWKMLENNESQSSYVPSDNNSANTNTEATIPIDSPNIAKIQNPAEAEQRLNDFQRKITSSPFENGAVEIVKIIDNDYAKCIVFLSKILYYDAYIGNAEEGGYDKITCKVSTLYLYDAANDNLYEFNNNNFMNYDITQLPHKRNYYKDYNHYDFSVDEENIASHYKMIGYKADDIFNNSDLEIADYSTKNFLILQGSSLYKDYILKINLSNFKVKSFKKGEDDGKGTIYDDKYIVIPKSGYNGYKVIDLYSEKEIDNPFWTAGTYSLYGKDYEFDFTVSNNGKVTGKFVMKGQEYKGSECIYEVVGNGVIRSWPFGYFIQKKGNRFFLYELKSLEERYGTEYNEYGIFGSEYGVDDEYAYSFFDHKAENIKASDIKKTTELFMK